MNNNETNKTHVPGTYVNVKAIVGVAISVVLVIAMIVGIAVEQLKPSLYMTIDGDKLYDKDLMYFVYQTESQYNYMDALYRQFYGSGYWDQADENGVSNRINAKNELENNIRQFYILYKEAVKAGYKINDEDKKSAAENVKDIRDNLSLKQKGLKGMSKKDLTKTAERAAMADRYKKDMIDKFDIDDAKLKAGVKKSEYKQYDVQYYSVPLGSYDEENNFVKPTDKEKEAAKAELERLADLAKTEDFDKLLGDSEEEVATDDANEKEEDKEKDENKVDSIASFTDSENGKFVAGSSAFGTDAEKKVVALKNDEISDIIETDNAYYLVKMINNDCQDAYNEACDKAVKDEEDKQFNEAYSKLVEKYTFEVNYDEWDKLNLGSVVK